MLGGTVRELECQPVRGSTSCRIGVDWEVLDVASDAISYRRMTRARWSGW